MQITLATLKNATAQQVFDQAVRHLLTQGKKSQVEVVDPEGEDEADNKQCAYRNPEGLCCVAGCFISDEEYAKLSTMQVEKPKHFKFDKELLGIEFLTWDHLTHKNVVPLEHAYLMGELQLVHDGYEPERWAIRLEILGDKMNLNLSVLKEFGHE